MNKETQDAIDAAMQKISEAMLEESARIGALRYLVEQLYAKTFISNPEKFDSLLTSMIERTGAAPVAHGPMEQKALEHLKKRMAAHLQSFRLDVLRRIEQGPLDR
jgi:hypothetical protein